MKRYLKVVWIICLYGILLFIFLAATMSVNPSYYKFEVTSEQIYTAVIACGVYAVLFILLSVHWARSTGRQAVSKPLLEEHETQHQSDVPLSSH